VAIPRWRSCLRNGRLHKINETRVDTQQEKCKVITTLRATSALTCTLGVVTNIPYPTDSQEYPQLYFDQVKHLMGILHEINNGTPIRWNEDDLIINSVMQEPAKLTRRWLMRQSDWEDWHQSELLQHDKFEAQKMFGEPMPPPPGATILRFVWTYVRKLNGVKKARCTCDGSKRAGRAVTLAATFAASVDQTGARIFWAQAAIQNMIVYGADCGNAFAEAPAPVQTFYMLVDEIY